MSQNNYIVKEAIVIGAGKTNNIYSIKKKTQLKQLKLI